MTFWPLAGNILPPHLPQIMEQIVAMKRCFLLLLCAVSFTGCATGSHAEIGTAIGAVTGAVGGAAIGKKSGNGTTGALIGGAVGALAGSSIGKAMDEDQARRDRLIQESIGRRLAGRVSNSDIIEMTRAGLSDDIIKNEIRSKGVRRRPDKDALISLKQNGVSDEVIKAMQDTPPPAVAPARPARQVIVEEHYHHGPPVVPVYVRPTRVRHYYHAPPRPRRRRPRASVHMRF